MSARKREKGLTCEGRKENGHEVIGGYSLVFAYEGDYKNNPVGGGMLHWVGKGCHPQIESNC